MKVKTYILEAQGLGIQSDESMADDFDDFGGQGGSGEGDGGLFDSEGDAEGDDLFG